MQGLKKKTNQTFILFTYGEMGNLMNASLKALLNEQYKLVAELREENKKLKEIIRQLLWRFLHRNIANIEYEGEEIELGEGDYNYKIE